MLQAYSTDITVAANTAIPFNSSKLSKGCTATHPSADVFNLNKCGVYMVSVDASCSATATIQLFKDGVAQPEAQSTGGTSLSFMTLVQVDRNNSCCACSSPVSLQIMNAGTAEATFTDVNVVITKVA